MIRALAFTVLLAVAYANPTLPYFHDRGGRIVGGNAVDIENYPYQISLQLNGGHYCGGSIVNANTIVCAAHCTQNSASYYSVRAGSSIRGSGGQVRNVERIINHPRYGSNGFDSDVSIIKLSSPLEWTDGVQPIQLAPRGYQVGDGEYTTVSGWGALSSGGGSPTVLNAVDVPAVNQNVCSSAYPGSITDTMICAGVAGKDSCQGDSGGPLTHKDYLVGIVSWGRGCAAAGYPGVYCRVSAVRDFIDQHV